MSIYDAQERLDLGELPDGDFNTVAGFALFLFGRIPSMGDRVDWHGWNLEVSDMVGWRINKVRARRIGAVEASASEPYPLERLFGRVLSPLERFLRQATAGGIVLVATTALTLGIANSPLGESFAHFWEQRAGLQLGAWTLEQSLHH